MRTPAEEISFGKMVFRTLILSYRLSEIGALAHWGSSGGSWCPNTFLSPFTLCTKMRLGWSDHNCSVLNTSVVDAFKKHSLKPLAGVAWDGFDHIPPVVKMLTRPDVSPTQMYQKKKKKWSSMLDEWIDLVTVQHAWKKKNTAALMYTIGMQKNKQTGPF